MAVEFKVDHTRRATYLFPPEKLRINPELNGRYVETSVADLVEDFVAFGQTVPIVIRSVEASPWIVDGHRRWRAALEVNKRKLTPVPMKLECVPFKGNDQQAFLAAVRANHHRENATPVCDAHNIARMERFGMSLEEIGKVYHEDVKWVRGRLAFATLGKEASEAFTAGKLKAPAARVLAKLSEAQQRVKLAEAEQSGQEITAEKPVSDRPKKPSALQRVLTLKTELGVIIELGRMPLDVSGMSPEDAVVAVCGKLAEILQ